MPPRQPDIRVSDIIETRPPAFLIHILGWSALILAIDGFCAALLPLAAPSIMAEWKIDKASFGAVFAISQVGILAGAVMFGFLADRIGRRPTIVAGVALFGAASLLVGVSAQIDDFTIIRFVAACALGGVKPVIYALTIESAPRRMQATVVPLVYAGVSLGQVVAGVVASLIIPEYGWRTLFFAGATVALATAPLFYLRLPESLRFLTTRPQRRVELLQQIEASGVSEPIAPDRLIVLGDEAAADAKVFTPGQLFAGPLLILTPLVWIGEIIGSAITFFFLSWIPTLARAIGASEEGSLYALSAYSFGATIGPIILARLIDRQGPHWLWIAPAATVVPMAVMAFMHLNDLSLLPVLAVTGMLTVGVHLGIAGTFMQFYPTAIRANAVGWMIMIGGLGSVASPYLFGEVMARTTSATPALLIATALMALIVPITWWLCRQYRLLVPARPGDTLGGRDPAPATAGTHGELT